MKHEVDKLVANVLLTDGEIYLPQVGTLILVRRAARRLSSKALQRPYRELCLTTEQRGESLVAHIARIAGVGEERATDIYNEYVAQSLREGVFTIENLCAIKGATLQTFQQFEDMANPKGRGAVKVNPHTNYFIYVVAGLCAGIGLFIIIRNPFSIVLFTFFLVINGMASIAWIKATSPENYGWLKGK